MPRARGNCGAAGPIRCPGAGFTLLEMLVVMALLTVLTMMIVPLYGYSMSMMESRSARNDLTSLIDYVQQRAVVDSREYRIYFDEETRAFWVAIFAGVEEDEAIFQDVHEDYGRVQYLPTHLEFETLPRNVDRHRELHYLAFHPNGASDRASIEVKDGRGGDGGFRIETLGALGKVELTHR